MKKRILVSTGLLIVVGVTAAALSLGKPSTNANAEPNAPKTQLTQTNTAATQEQLPPATPVSVPTVTSVAATQTHTTQQPVANKPSVTSTTATETKPVQEAPTVTGCTNSIPQSCFPGPTPADPPTLTPEDPSPVACTNSIPQSCLYSDGTTRTQQSL